MNARERGSSLVEALVALALVSIGLAGILPSFTVQLQSNERSEERSSAVLAAQQILDGLRLQDPRTMPETGAGAPQLVRVGDLEFEVTTHYCSTSSYCSDDARHVLVEVERGGQKVYDAQTVYTRLR